MVKAGSHDSIFGSDYHSESKEVTDANQYFYRYDPKHLAKFAKWPC